MGYEISSTNYEIVSITYEMICDYNIDKCVHLAILVEYPC
jgi:hypothetical protein